MKVSGSRWELDPAKWLNKYCSKESTEQWRQWLQITRENGYVSKWIEVIEDELLYDTEIRSIKELLCSRKNILSGRMKSFFKSLLYRYKDHIGSMKKHYLNYSMLLKK